MEVGKWNRVLGLERKVEKPHNGTGDFGQFGTRETTSDSWSLDSLCKEILGALEVRNFDRVLLPRLWNRLGHVSNARNHWRGRGRTEGGHWHRHHAGHGTVKGWVSNKNPSMVQCYSAKMAARAQ